jgi:ABC-type glycerol-3-phosphate transport system permease component
MSPLLFAVIESVRSSTGSGLTMSNWADVFSQLPTGTGLMSFAILAVSASVLTVTVSFLAGFSSAKLPFPGSRVVLTVVIMTLALPLISAIVPEYLDFAHIHAIGSYLPPIVVYSAFNAAFGVIFFTSYFLPVPDALLESARTEGAGYLTFLLRIAVPIAVPALITLGVYDFMLVWNDLLVALLFLPQADHQTISVILATINSAHTVRTQMLLAGSLLSILPSVVIFLCFQRYLVLGFSLGIEK